MIMSRTRKKKVTTSKSSSTEAPVVIHVDKKYLLGLKLYNATYEGNFTEALTLLAAGANPQFNQTNEFQDTPLIAAAYRDQGDIARLLLGKKINPNQQNTEGCTALLIAAQLNNAEIVELLIKHGADVNAIHDKTKVTPLYIAAQLNHIDTVRLLLNNKADHNLRGHESATPLHIASQMGSLEVAELLLQHGANPNLGLLDDGITPLYLAVEKKKVKIVKLLLANWADANRCNSTDGGSPLHVAAQASFIEAAAMLLQNGAKINAVTKEGATALHISIALGDMNMASYLLSQGAAADIKMADGICPLAMAITRKHAKREMIDLVISHLIKNKTTFNEHIKTLAADLAACDQPRMMLELILSLERNHVETKKIILLMPSKFLANKETVINYGELAAKLKTMLDICESDMQIAATPSRQRRKNPAKKPTEQNHNFDYIYELLPAIIARDNMQLSKQLSGHSMFAKKGDKSDAENVRHETYNMK
tara:strand:+ start:1135 stop:2577 length:1443 start_codon:yes stop_codon:yes gene_type:complete